MAMVVCCPCGTPVDCEHIELVVTLSCPACNKEINIELEDPNGRVRRALLTVMSGPYWVGEQFVIPIGEPLRIGRAAGNWLSLDSEHLSDVHCSLNVTPDGHIIIEDQGSRTGVWVNRQRIARGKLAPMQSFRVGEFKFRFDMQSPDGTTVVAAPSATAAADESGPLPFLSQVQQKPTPLRWLVSNRYRISRLYMQPFAWLMGLYHLLAFRMKSDGAGPWFWSLLGAAAIAAGLALAGRRLTLVHRHFKYASLASLLVLAVIDLMLALPVPAIACLFLAACLTVMILRVPSGWLALLGALVGFMAVCMAVTGDWYIVRQFIETH